MISSSSHRATRLVPRVLVSALLAGGALSLGASDADATPGCPPGWRLEAACADGCTGDTVEWEETVHVCVDIDECAEQTATCHETSVCTNQAGAYDCSCAPGFEGDGSVCWLVDPCAAYPELCGQAGPCLDGSELCDPCQEDPEFCPLPDCADGFASDGVTCQNIDECELGASCDADAHCVDLAPGFLCACDDGFAPGETGCLPVSTGEGGGSGEGGASTSSSAAATTGGGTHAMPERAAALGTADGSGDIDRSAGGRGPGDPELPPDEQGSDEDGGALDDDAHPTMTAVGDGLQCTASPASLGDPRAMVALLAAACGLVARRRR